MEEHERRATALADQLQDEAERMFGRGGIDAARGKELALASVRARNLAAELAGKRADREQRDRLMAEYRKMEGFSAGTVRVGASGAPLPPRAPLKRKRRED